MQEQTKKYQLITEINQDFGIALYRIQALKDIPDFGVKAGDLGGFVQHEGNLSQTGTAWIAQSAKVFGKAKVTSAALISGQAVVRDMATVSDNAIVSGSSIVRDKALVSGHAEIRDRAIICDSAWVGGHAIVVDAVKICGATRFDGTAAVSGDKVIDHGVWLEGIVS